MINKAALTERLATEFKTDISITTLRQLSGGACQENYLLGLASADKQTEYVLRTDKGGALLGSLTRPQEYAVIKTAVRAGVQTPAASCLCEETSIAGHPFYLMEKITGTANPRDILKSKKIDFGQLARDLAGNLARIHSIEYSPATLPFIDRKLKSGTNDIALTAIADCRRLLDEMPGGYPATELCLNWAETHAPVTEKIVLAHGDFRSGNFMVDNGKLTGLLDWEFAHWSDPHEDIGYLRMRDWRFGKVRNEIGGFSDPQTFYSAYEEAGGTKIDTTKVRFWEIMGNLRWAIGAAQQGERHLSGKDRGIEFASIGRRVAEMEWEAMRLIEEVA